MWALFVTVYAVLAFAYLFYRQLLLMFSSQQYKKNFSDRVSVVVAEYNEDPQLLLKSITSLLQAKNVDEVILVDDGSPNDPTSFVSARFAGLTSRLRIIQIPHKGKREAQFTGVRLARFPFICFVDSDSLIAKNAVKELLLPFEKKKTGAVTGNIFVLNENENLLTRSIAARYWNAFNVERAGLGGFGSVTCLTGVLSLYRKDLLLQIEDKYLEQKFLGKQCTYGDDRHLTNLVLKKGFETVYQRTAKAWTVSPQTIGELFRQQLRWKKSWIRETFILVSTLREIFKFSKKRSFVLGVDSFFQVFLVPSSFVIRLWFWISMLFFPVLAIAFFVMVFFMAGIRSLNMIFSVPEKYVYSVIYGFLYEFVLVWTLPVAFLSLSDTDWGTRKIFSK